jgi:sarcosine oxidase subunit beta
VSERVSVLIVGGGIIGSGIAWALAERGVDGVVVLDLDLAGVYASSELNAGGARATWWQPVNVETCRLTLDFFRAHAAEFGFREAGYLWLYDDPGLWARARERSTMQAAHGIDVEKLDVAELARRFSLLDRALDELVGATFSPRDGLVNPNAVRAFYRREAEARGVRFLNRHYVTGVETALATGASCAVRRVAAATAIEVRRVGAADEEGVLRAFLTHHHVPADHVVGEHRIACDTIVNALGAWSPIFSAKLGVRDATEPVRRQIALVHVHASDLPAGVRFADLGMIVDASGLYFHPEGPHVLAGYSIPDEPAGFDFRYDGDVFFEREIWPRLAHRASAFERCGHVRGWAGLYAVTPDRSGVAGAVRRFSNLYEAHSFTGRGVMQSYAIAQGMASLIATGRFAEVDLAPLGGDRFDDPAHWIPEALHI